MVSQFWVNMFSGLAANYGMSSSALAILFTFVWAIGFSIMITIAFDNEHKKQIGLISFLGWLLFFTFIELLDWYTLGLIFLVFFGIWGYTRTKGEGE